jgi:monofunctional biosynthetic peptidoglycan transglycosylase
VEREDDIRRQGPHERSLRRIQPARRATGARRIAVLAMRFALGLVALTLVLTLVYRVVMPVSTPMLGRWLTAQLVTRETVPLERISPALVRAVFTAEDQKFCMHHGVDWASLTDVLDEEAGPSRGASTITMQTVKNVYLWRGRSYLRKAIEIPLSFIADLFWGKRRTMEIYLNVAEWGEGIFGAEAAARHWFNKSARDLRSSEAILLAATLPNPIARNPRRPSAVTRAKAARIQAAYGAMDDYIGCLDPR